MLSDDALREMVENLLPARTGADLRSVFALVRQVRDQVTAETEQRIRRETLESLEPCYCCRESGCQDGCRCDVKVTESE